MLTRLLTRTLISGGVVILINLLVLLLAAISMIHLVSGVVVRADTHDPNEISTGVGVILIGWGVALEERGTLREMFRLTGGADEARQQRLDLVCHHVGLGILLLGLFIELLIELARLPDDIIVLPFPNSVLLMASVVLMVVSMIALVRHVGQVAWIAIARR